MATRTSAIEDWLRGVRRMATKTLAKSEDAPCNFNLFTMQECESQTELYFKLSQT